MSCFIAVVKWRHLWKQWFHFHLADASFNSAQLLFNLSFHQIKDRYEQICTHLYTSYTNQIKETILRSLREYVAGGAQKCNKSTTASGNSSDPYWVLLENKVNVYIILPWPAQMILNNHRTGIKNKNNRRCYPNNCITVESAGPGSPKALCNWQYSMVKKSNHVMITLALLFQSNTAYDSIQEPFLSFQLKMHVSLGNEHLHY